MPDKMKSWRGSAKGKYSKSDGADLSKQATVAAASAVATWALGNFFPDMPDEIRSSCFVVGFALFHSAVQFFTDTSRWS